MKIRIKKEALLKGFAVTGVGGAGMGIGTLLVKPNEQEKDELIIFQKQENENLAAKNSDLESEIEKLKEQLEFVVPTIDWVHVRDKFEENKTENRNLKKLVEQLSKSLGENVDAEDRIAGLNNKIQTLEDTTNYLEEENERINGLLDLEKKIVKTLDSDRNKKDARIAELEKKLRDVSDEYQMTNQWVDQLEDSLTSKLEEVKNLKEALNDALKRLDEKDEEIKSTKAWLTIKEGVIKEKNKKLATYQKLDPQNYRRNDCSLGLDKQENPTLASVACKGWFDSKGSIDKNILVQLFFKKDEVGDEFQKWVDLYNGIR